MTFYRQSCDVLERLITLKMKISILLTEYHIFLLMLVLRIERNLETTSSFRVSYFHYIFAFHCVVQSTVENIMSYNT